MRIKKRVTYGGRQVGSMSPPDSNREAGGREEVQGSSSECLLSEFLSTNPAGSSDRGFKTCGIISVVNRTGVTNGVNGQPVSSLEEEAVIFQKLTNKTRDLPAKKLLKNGSQVNAANGCSVTGFNDTQHVLLGSSSKTSIHPSVVLQTGNRKLSLPGENLLELGYGGVSSPPILWGTTLVTSTVFSPLSVFAHQCTVQRSSDLDSRDDKVTTSGLAGPPQTQTMSKQEPVVQPFRSPSDLPLIQLTDEYDITRYGGGMPDYAGDPKRT